jgi:hypothetical protein
VQTAERRIKSEKLVISGQSEELWTVAFSPNG